MLQAESQFVIALDIDCVSRAAHINVTRHESALLIPQARCAFRLSPLPTMANGEVKAVSQIVPPVFDLAPLVSRPS